MDEDQTEERGAGAIEVSRVAEGEEDMTQFYLKSSSGKWTAESASAMRQRGVGDGKESQEEQEAHMTNGSESQETSLHGGPHHIRSWNRSEQRRQENSE